MLLHSGIGALLDFWGRSPPRNEDSTIFVRIRTIQVDCFCPNLIFKIFKIVSGEEGEHFCLDTNIFLDESLNEEDIDFEVLLLIREEESSAE